LGALTVLAGFVGVALLELRAYMGTAALRLIQYPIKLVVVYFLWKAVYSAAQDRLPLDFATLAAYYAATLLIGQMYSFYRVTRQTEADIRTYSIDLHLCRPVVYWMKPAAPLILGVLGYFALALPFGLLVFWLLGLPLPSLGGFLTALSILAVGIPLRFLIWYVMGLTAFWTEETGGLQSLFGWIESLLSGALIPLALLPGGFVKVVAWLPFQGYVSLPVEAALGMVGPEQLVTRLLVVAAWTVLLGLLASVVWRQGRRYYQSGGG
jgi:ABC-2 type transport system permease protein